MIGEYITSKRKIQKISQEELAFLVNVSRQTVYKWEANICEPTLTHFIGLIIILKINIHEVINDYKKANKLN